MFAVVFVAPQHGVLEWLTNTSMTQSGTPQPSLFDSAVANPFAVTPFKDHSTRLHVYMSSDGNKEVKYYPVQALQKCHR